VEEAETNESSDDADLGDEGVVCLAARALGLFVGGLGAFLGAIGRGRPASVSFSGTCDEAELDDLGGSPGGFKIGLSPILLGSGDTTSVAARRTIWGGVAGRCARTGFGLGAGFGTAAGLLCTASSCPLGLKDLGGVGGRSFGLAASLCCGDGSLFLTGSVSPWFSNMDISDVVRGIGLVSTASTSIAEESTLFAPKLRRRLGIAPNGLWPAVGCGETCAVWFGVGEADLLAASVAAMKEVDLPPPPGERR